MSANPIHIVEEKARALYKAFRRKRPRDAFGNVAPAWMKLRAHEREEWRGRAMASLRSEESLADELGREDRERRKSNGQ